MFAGRHLRLMFRSLSHRNYRLFFNGQLISLVGTWMQTVALSWLIYRMTHSAWLLGASTFASQFPGFVLAPIGGAVADRANLRRLVVVTQVASMLLAFLLAALTLEGSIQVWEIFLLSGVLGVVNAFDMPARQAFFVELVDRQDLINAISLNSSMYNCARIVGPAVAAGVLAVVGEGWCFFGNAVSYIAVIIGLLMMKLPPKHIAPPSTSATQHVLEGLSYAAKTPSIRAILILLAVVSLIGTPYATFMPIFADEILKGGPSGLGILMGMTGVGALAGTLSLALKRETGDLSQWIGFSAVGAGASLILFAISKHFWLSTALLFPVGFFLIVQMACSNTLIQSVVPDRLRGRVMAVYLMMFIGMSPIGSLVSGVVAKPLGVPLTIALGGAGCMIAGAVFWMYLPQIQNHIRNMNGLSRPA